MAPRCAAARQARAAVRAAALRAPAQSAASTAPVKETLQQYSARMESLDADQVKKIYPTVDVEGLRRAFRDMRELKVSIDAVRVLSIDGSDRARELPRQCRPSPPRRARNRHPR